jgi:hypothetical protein
MMLVNYADTILARGETMRAAFGIVGLLMTLSIGYYIYSSQMRGITNNKPIKQQTNLVAVRSDLLSLAQSERLYMASNGSYATLEQLRQSNFNNSFPEGNRLGYTYAADVDGDHFRITASPTGSFRADLPALSIDETMRIDSQD